MFVIVFASASLAIVPASPASAEVLAPFADEREARAAGLTADDYAAACQSIAGQEFSVSSLIELGVLDEDGEPTEGVVVVRAA